MSDQPPQVTQPAIAEAPSMNRDAEGLAPSDKGYSDQGYSDQGYSDQGYSDQGQSDQGYSWIAASLWLSGSLIILVLATIMSVGPARRVFLPGVSVPMPETCMMHARFGIDCPGCGLTRSFIHIAHGRILESFSLNPAGIAIFLFVAAQVPAALLRFTLGRSSRFAILWTRSNEIALIILPTVTCIQWIVRLVIGDY